MANGNINEVLFELLDSGGEALDFLQESMCPDSMDTCVVVSQPLGELYENIAVLIDNNNISQEHRGREAALNAAIAAGKMYKLCSDGDLEEAEFLLTYELLPLHIFLSNELIFWFEIFPDMEKLREYRDRQLEGIIEYKQSHKEVLEMDYTYDVSVVILCYNKVYLTKIALESVLAYTDFKKYRVEIIVINNGSDDNGETSTYLRGLNDSRIKTVDLKYPLGYNGYSLGPIAAGGRYFVEFHTDVIATTNWLNNLINCISSDPNIGAVVAVCNESSNNQMISVDYADPIENDAELQCFAKKYNNPDPQKWEDRARIMPTSGFITPTILYRRLLRDPWLQDGFFTDDDMSVFLRRSGFRQVLARDTFLHHFGSQTSSAIIAGNYSTDVMRRRFYDKWGVDAFYSSSFNPAIVHYMKYQNFVGSESFLFIDPLFGTTAMYVYNQFRENSKNLGETAAIVSDKRYAADARRFFNKAMIGSAIETLTRLQSKYDYVVFCPDIEEYIDMDFPELLKAVHSVCKAGAKVLFTLNNPAFFVTLVELANGIVSVKSQDLWKGIRFIDPKYVRAAVEEQGFCCSTGDIPWQQVEQLSHNMQRMQTLANNKKLAEAMSVMSLFFELTL